MATLLRRPVRRRVPREGRDLVVTLRMAAKPLIYVREFKRRGEGYGITVGELFIYLARRHADRVRAEKLAARRARRSGR